VSGTFPRSLVEMMNVTDPVAATVPVGDAIVELGATVTDGSVEIVVAVSTGTRVGVSVGTTVAVSVGIAVGVSVGTVVAVSVGIAVGVSVGTVVAVFVGAVVAVGVSVGSGVRVAVGVEAAGPTSIAEIAGSNPWTREISGRMDPSRLGYDGSGVSVSVIVQVPAFSDEIVPLKLPSSTWAVQMTPPVVCTGSTVIVRSGAGPMIEIDDESVGPVSVIVSIATTLPFSGTV
jgi:hypothetical protein